MPGEGLEPSRPYGQRILSPQRLPIPPSGHEFLWEDKGRGFVLAMVFFCGEGDF